MAAPRKGRPCLDLCQAALRWTSQEPTKVKKVAEVQTLREGRSSLDARIHAVRRWTSQELTKLAAYVHLAAPRESNSNLAALVVMRLLTRVANPAGDRSDRHPS